MQRNGVETFCNPTKNVALCKCNRQSHNPSHDNHARTNDDTLRNTAFYFLHKKENAFLVVLQNITPESLSFKCKKEGESIL